MKRCTVLFAMAILAITTLYSFTPTAQAGPILPPLTLLQTALADVTAKPVVHSTWGAIKALYRAETAIDQSPTQSIVQKPGVGQYAMPNYCFYLNVPWMSQVPPGDWANTNNCGQAVCAMLGAYFNGGSTASWVIDAENRWLGCPLPNGCQTGSSTLQRLLQGFHNLRSSVYTGYGADDVVMEGARGRPVIVGVRTYMSTTGRAHWMLFIGWDGTYMYFDDPGRSYMSSDWTAGHLRCTPSQFYASWNSFPSYPRTYIPVYR